jgi:hypothetical protein
LGVDEVKGSRPRDLLWNSVADVYAAITSHPFIKAHGAHGAHRAHGRLSCWRTRSER